MNVLKDYVFSKDKRRQPLVRIMAYCVMGNHYHLLVEEIQKGGITKFMHKFGTGYTGYFNNKHERVGRLFQNTFKSVLVDNELYLQYLLVYINILNPAELVESHWKECGIRNIGKVLSFARKYKFSSHLDYLGERGSLIIDKGILGEILPTRKAYFDLVKSVLQDKHYQTIDHLTIE